MTTLELVAWIEGYLEAKMFAGLTKDSVEVVLNKIKEHKLTTLPSLSVTTDSKFNVHYTPSTKTILTD